MIRTRDIDPHSEDELALVARRMRETLIEVEGRERGESLYTLAWLRDRVRWHLAPAQTNGRVVLAHDADASIVGHTILRIESPQADPVGLVSTTYVLPSARRKGVATALLTLAEAWFVQNDAGISCTWTSATNAPLIELYTRHGYRETERGPNDLNGTPMIKLATPLTRRPAD